MNISHLNLNLRRKNDKSSSVPRSQQKQQFSQRDSRYNDNADSCDSPRSARTKGTRFMHAKHFSKMSTEALEENSVLHVAIQQQLHNFNKLEQAYRSRESSIKLLKKSKDAVESSMREIQNKQAENERQRKQLESELSALRDKCAKKEQSKKQLRKELSLERQKR